MFTRILVLGTVLVALLALILPQQKESYPPFVKGRNGTALFLVNQEHGVSNVLVATASALLEKYPDIEIHFASFPKLKGKLERVSKFAQRKTPAARDIVFHQLKSPAYAEVIVNAGRGLDDVPHPPGLAGIAHLCRDMQLWISPWSADEHLSIYEEVDTIIDEVDPAVVVVDTLFRPGLDATRDKNRQHAFITPNQAVDNFLGDQPYGSMFWKYPAMSSGFPFPVPWTKIPENIYLNFRFIYSVLRMPDVAAKRKVLRERGLKDPINFFGMYRDDVPWITVTAEGASIPVDFLPSNVTLTNPIVLSVAPAEEQDPVLVEWLKKTPTVLINLGSTVAASVMTQAIAQVLDKVDIQFLWKFNKFGNYSDDVFLPVKKHLDSGRLKLERWLTVDPTSLLESGLVVASIHHGGANCYNEAVYAGVPHVVLPLWADLYNYASLAETYGVGVWGCPGTSPNWTAEGLSQAFLKVLDGGEASVAMREKARKLGDRIQAAEKGRDVAARKVAELAYSGVSGQ
ncbi:2-hydroxyacylsphingosine 1-beta-galactosyltransferase [Fusarium longipes]|uniref:2-hydroxyacylsphingosine 1-beta-galactosyltransferase n=1 Tax=Fusarium longipes TaxID=694270 RepID=A0A395SHY2_9HYPO|nr:2-hydroxyacylsphingosine 1-beta-galactosyltransferase [Fusarium longipes]